MFFEFFQRDVGGCKLLPQGQALITKNLKHHELDLLASITDFRGI